MMNSHCASVMSREKVGRGSFSSLAFEEAGLVWQEVQVVLGVLAGCEAPEPGGQDPRLGSLQESHSHSLGCHTP